MGAGKFREKSGTETSQTSGWLPDTEAHRAAVREQLERILASPGFRNSRKYPAFLRYVVERTLNGEADHLKERTLGVEVFGRPPEYDTSVDPVVRIVAAEVRKRIGQYYYESAAQGEVLLDLHSGTYVPRFSVPQQTAELPPPKPAGISETVVELPVVTQPSRRFRLRRFGPRSGAWLIGVLLLSTLLAAAAVWLTRPRTAAMSEFWGPVLESPGPILLVTGGGATWMTESSILMGATTPATSPSIDEQQSGDLIAVADASTLAGLAGILRVYRKAYLIRPSKVMDLPQLRSGSAVLVGALNNPWTLRLTANLRFAFMRDSATNTNWIQDRKNPGMRDWKVMTTMPFTMVTEDWAVISHFKDPDTEHWIVTAPGLSRWGTIAAGEFLTNPIYLEELARRAPANWGRKNLQVVIATKVINGQPGPPRILATEFW